jgi:hypothetical protein
MLGLGFPPADCPVQIDPFEHPFAAPFAEQPSAFLDHAVPPYFLAQGAMLIPHDLSDWAGSKVGKKYASELALRRWTNRIREQGANADSIARFVIKHGLVAEKALPDVVQLGKAASLIIAGPMLDARNQAYRIRSCQWIGNTLELRLLVFRTNDIHFISGERVPEYPLILIPFESKTVGRYLLRAVWERPTESGYEEWEVQELSFGVIE